MAILFSPSECGFFDTRISYPNLPPDVVEISEDRWRELLEAQGQGWRIVATPNGQPDLVKRE